VFTGTHRIALARPRSIEAGPLAPSQGEAPHLHWLARLLGRACTTFLAPCANASLIRILSGVHLSFPAYRSLAGSRNDIGWLPAQVPLAIQSRTLRQTYPRAPPMPVAVPSRNLVGSAHWCLNCEY